jgi:hypothetical protein
LNQQLEERLRAVYRQGYLEQIDVDACDFSCLDPLEAMLRARLAPWGVGLDKFCVWSQLERVATASISLWAADGVPWKAGTTRPHQRLAETGQPGVVCILTVSTVYPAWDCYFNLWTPRDDPSGTSLWAEHPACALLEEVDAPPIWNRIVQAMGECCAAQGLVRLGKAELQEAVPFVTESMWNDDDDDDDGGNASDDFTPSPEQQACNVAQCLFQQH